jgi:hypothetical protein
MTLILAPILFIGLIIYVAYPFLQETAERAVRERRDSDRRTVQKLKDDAITALKDIDMDYRMGKLSDEDYEVLKAQQEERAVDAMKKLEGLKKKRKKS